MKTTQFKFKKLPETRTELPTDCFNCDTKNAYHEVIVQGESELRNETFVIKYTCMECSNCGHRLLSPEQMAAKVRATVEAFQIAHGLLTAKEVVSKRKALGYRSQDDFAKVALGLSLPTLKRLEAGQRVQDPSTDTLLRMAFTSLEKQQRNATFHGLLREPLLADQNFEAKVSKQTACKYRNVINSPLPLAACITLAVASQAMVSIADQQDVSFSEIQTHEEYIRC